MPKMANKDSYALVSQRYKKKYTFTNTDTKIY